MTAPGGKLGQAIPPSLRAHLAGIAIRTDRRTQLCLCGRQAFAGTFPTAKTGTKTTKYEYNADGLRTRKTNADGTYSDYYWIGSMLLAEVQYKANGTRIRTLKFCYDEKGSPIGFVHIDASGTDSFYYYAKNLQGDVVALYRWNWSDEGKHTVTLEATYSYDPWGKLLSVKSASGSPISATLTTNIANVNPFRYRGYYYDNETGFYYLQSRYYDPVISRFINADEYASTGQDFLGCNMFAYCNNNPINADDHTGYFLERLITGIGGALVGAGLGALTTWITGGTPEEIGQVLR